MEESGEGLLNVYGLSFVEDYNVLRLWWEFSSGPVIRFGFFTAMAWVQFLLEELRSYKLGKTKKVTCVICCVLCLVTQ